MIFSKASAALSACLISLALTACGGGGGSSSSNVIDGGGGGAAQLVKPSIGTPPENQSVVAGQSATFTVTATGSEAGGALSYQWKKGGTDIAGATSSSYTIQATSMADSGAYSVAVSNSAGTTTSTAATLTVTAAAVAPAISTQPASKTVTAGQAATFTVVATGTAPLAYQWKKNGTAVSGATSSTYTTPATSMGDSSAVFTVVVSNGTGTVTSTTATLTVTAAAGAPAIGTQPADQTVTAGESATFSVTATGTSLSYQWRKGGADIPNATSSSYTTPATSVADSGTVYSVAVTNSAGTVASSNATLTVNQPAIAISSAPADISITAGTTATFSVTATGAGTLSYQWKKNGVNITGGTGATTPTYTTPVMSYAGNGAVYSVVVTDSANASTATRSATLTVNKTSTAKSYGQVANASDGLFAKEECVQDNNTGLIWEGKPTTGTRAASNTYTNYDATNTGGTNITIGTNSIGFVNFVNGSSLCGYTDWRRPEIAELAGLVVSDQTPTIDNGWFLNTQSLYYWSATAYVAPPGVPPVSDLIYLLLFSDGHTYNFRRNFSTYSTVRLVRGTSP